MIGCKNISPIYSLLFFLLLQLIHPNCAETETAFNNLPVCRNFQACGSRLRVFPTADETIGELIEEIDSSGHGSGADHEQTQMQYDEFVTTKTPFDFNADPQLVQKRLCRCADESKSTKKINN